MFSEADIKEKIEALLAAADIPARVHVTRLHDTSFSVALLLDEEAGYLIGRGGEHLDALEHIIRLVINKHLEQPVRIFVDLNDYKEHRAVLLRERAQAVAERVKICKQAEILEPMTAFERRIIHLELAGRGDVITESIGEESQRQIVIKPAE